MQLNQALSLAPQDPNVHVNLGWLYLYTNDQDQAKAELAKLEKLAPDMAETYHLKGAILNNEAQDLKDEAAANKLREEAVADYKTALERDSKNDQTWFDLASTQSALGQYEDALDSLSKGFDYIPEHDLETQVNFQIASCNAHAKLGLLEEAIADCKQAEEFATNPQTKSDIEDMVENMKLLNPGTVPEGSVKIPQKGSLQPAGGKEEDAVINDEASD